MQTERTYSAVAHERTTLIDLIDAGEVVGIKRFTLDPTETENGWAIQTLAVAIPAGGSSRFPIVVIETHKTDNLAMDYAVSVFEALRYRGIITSDQRARYRRGLLTLVPSDATVI
jgi:hypothetical protein